MFTAPQCYRFFLSLFVIFGIHFSLFAQKKVVLGESVYFETNSFILSENARTDLLELSTKVQNQEELKLVIEAHTDEAGTTAFNENLAEKRASAVHAYLLGLGLSTDKVQIAAFGESRPLADNRNEAGRAKNRRVDVQIEQVYWESTADLLADQYAQMIQRFTIAKGEAVLVNGRSGSQIWLEYDDFIQPNGQSVSGPINVELVEALTLNDMVLADLHTLSDGKILRTGGMINLQASADGQPLTLGSDVELMMSIPTPEFDEEMEIFTGLTDTQQKLENWTPVEQPVAPTRLAALRIARRPYFNQKPFGEAPPKVENEPDFIKKPVRPTKPRIRLLDAEKEIKVYGSWFEQRFQKKKLATEQNEKQTAHQERVSKQIERKKYYDQRYDEALNQYLLDSMAYETKVAERKELLEKLNSNLRNSEPWVAYKKRRDAFYAAQKVEIEELQRKYQEYYDRKMAAYNKAYEERGVTNQEDLERYFFTTQQLGWINVDRFLKEVQNGTLEIFANNDVEAPAVFLVFEELKSILAPSRTVDQTIAYDRLPIGQKAKIVALSVQNGKPLLAVQEFVITDNQQLTLNFEPTEIKNLKQLF